MKTQTQLLYYIFNIMTKHEGDQPVFVYFRACARDDHHSAPCISLGAAQNVLAQGPSNGSHLLPDGFLELGGGG